VRRRRVVAPSESQRAEAPVAASGGADQATESRAGVLRSRLWKSCAILVATALMLSGVMALMHAHHVSQERDARQAARVATKSLAAILSFTPRDVMRNADKESALLGGSLRSTYLRKLKQDWGPAAQKRKVTTVAEVVRVGRASVNGGTVKLIVFANMSRRLAGSDEGDVIASTMLITMEKVDGTWRIMDYRGV